LSLDIVLNIHLFNTLSDSDNKSDLLEFISFFSFVLSFPCVFEQSQSQHFSKRKAISFVSFFK